MGLADTAFKVVTEFRFDIAHAVADSEQLQGSLETLSQSADHALGSFQRLSLGVVASMGLGSGGLVGTLYTAIKAADKFKTTQIGMANLMSDGTTSFDTRMASAAGHMEHINALANEFALPADDLLQLTKLTAPMIRDKKGMPDFRSATDLSRNLMKAAPTLGVQTGMIMGQMQSAISGHASLQDTLFQRLTSDTKGMHHMSSQQFNALPEAKRIETLRKALKEFTSDTKTLEANVNTLNGQMQILKNNVQGAFSILRPIGEQLLNLILPAFKQLNAWLSSDGKLIGEKIASAIEPWMSGGWKNIVVTLMQLRDLGSDTKLASRILQISGLLYGLYEILHKFGITVPYLTTGLGKFHGAIQFLESSITKSIPQIIRAGADFSQKFASSIYKGLLVVIENFGSGKIFAIIGGFFTGLSTFIVRAFAGFRYLAVILSTILAPLLLLVFVFQLFSRAAAIAKLDGFESILKAVPVLSEAMRIFSRISALMMEGFNGMAEVISPIFSNVLMTMMGNLGQFFLTLVTGVGIMIMLFEGFFLAIFEFFNQIKSFLSGDGFSFKKIGDAFSFGMDETFDKIFGKVKSGDATANMVTNIGKVEIQNQFKEQAEPDRVAFTLVEQLKKAAINPSGSGGRSMKTSLYGAGA